MLLNRLPLSKLLAMGRRRRQLPRYDGITIHGLSSEGFGVARHNDKVVFVEDAVPGDQGDVQVTKRKRRFDQAQFIRRDQTGTGRVTAQCKHQSVCGGCRWMIADYSLQLSEKQSIVENAFKRIGHLEHPPIEPILGAKKLFNYRNKIEFTFGARRWLTNEEVQSSVEFDRDALGFHPRGRFQNVVQIDECHLVEDSINILRNSLYNKAKQEGWTFFDPLEHTGLLRQLCIRVGHDAEGIPLLMVILVTSPPPEDFLHQIAQFLEGLQLDTAISLYHIESDKKNDSWTDLKAVHLLGPESFFIPLGKKRFQIKPQSFFQTNTEQAIALYDVVKKYAHLTGKEHVFDLYCGVGSIGLYLSDECAKITGIELIPEAIEDAAHNAQLNDVHHAEYHTGDVGEFINTNHLTKENKPDLIITDPPRSGMHQEVAEHLRDSSIERIVYVSCNPSTQARDLAILCERYDIEAVQPVDMFPQTPHIECVVALTLKK